jgi:hypothetical protein
MVQRLGISGIRAPWCGGILENDAVQFGKYEALKKRRQVNPIRIHSQRGEMGDVHTAGGNEWSIDVVPRHAKLGTPKGCTILENVQVAIHRTTQLGRVQGSEAFPTHEFLRQKLVHNDRFDGGISEHGALQRQLVVGVPTSRTDLDVFKQRGGVRYLGKVQQRALYLMVE